MLSLNLEMVGPITTPITVVATLYRGRANQGTTNMLLRRTDVSASVTLPLTTPSSGAANYQSCNGSGSAILRPGEYQFVGIQILGAASNQGILNCYATVTY